MIVLKIGGSSVDSAAAIARIVELVRSFRERRPVVVVSAMAKTTNRLLESAAAAAAGNLERAETILAQLLAFHRTEGELAVPFEARPALDRTILGFFAELRQALFRIAEAGALTARDADAVASCGELVSSSIFASALSQSGLEAPWIDCRAVVITDGDHSRARPIYEETEPRLRAALLPHLESGRIPVLGGYVGATLDGTPTTLGKEGSDFSAAIVGAALAAEEVVLCTDVDGILTADPRLYPAARRIRTLSFAETLELASSGGKKPHFGTLGPATRAGVPLRIVPSRAPQSPGTVVGRRDGTAPSTLKSIVCRSHEATLTLSASGAIPGELLLERLREPFERLRPALLLLECEPNRIRLALERSERLEEVRSALLETLGADVALTVTPGRTVVTLVSEDLGSDPEFAARCLAALAGLPAIAADGEPRLLTRGVAAPVVRFQLPESGPPPLPEVLADLHQRIYGVNDGLSEGSIP